MNEEEEEAAMERFLDALLIGQTKKIAAIYCAATTALIGDGQLLGVVDGDGNPVTDFNLAVQRLLPTFRRFPIPTLERIKQHAEEVLRRRGVDPSADVELVPERGH